MAPRSKSKKQRLAEFLREGNIAAIGEEEWGKLAALLAPISENYLRELLHETGLPVAQPFCGVRMSSFEMLEESLVEMEKAYAGGDPARALACRRVVIQAKDRARMISRNQKVDPEKRAQKAEMVEWMLVWLENPGIFGAWAELRKRAATVCPTRSG